MHTRSVTRPARRRPALAAASGLAALALVLGACGNDGDAEDAEADRAYLAEVRASGVEVRDDEDYLIRGHDACRDLEGEAGYFDVLQRYNDEHPDAAENEGQIVVQAAVNAFCPDYQPALAE